MHIDFSKKKKKKKTKKKKKLIRFVSAKTNVVFSVWQIIPPRPGSIPPLCSSRPWRATRQQQNLSHWLTSKPHSHKFYSENNPQILKWANDDSFAFAYHFKWQALMAVQLQNESYVWVCNSFISFRLEKKKSFGFFFTCFRWQVFRMLGAAHSSRPSHICLKGGPGKSQVNHWQAEKEGEHIPKLTHCAIDWQIRRKAILFLF